MSILVKLSTTLRDYVPGYDPEAGITLDAPEDATAADVARMVGLPLEEIKIVMINGRQKEVQSNKRRCSCALFSCCRRSLDAR